MRQRLEAANTATAGGTIEPAELDADDGTTPMQQQDVAADGSFRDGHWCDDAFEEEDVFGHGGELDQPVGEHLNRGPMRSTANFRGDSVACSSEIGTGSAASSGHPPRDSDISADINMTECIGEGDGTATSVSGNHHHRLVLTAMAKGVQTDAFGACEGPGDPRADRATVEVAAEPCAPATTTVAATAREATTLQCFDHHARQASAERGKVAAGPPRGAAAPLDGRGCTGCNWPEANSPHKRPRRLGVGPSMGHAGLPHNGEGPAKTRSKERRRDGTEAPVPGAVARGGGDATACQEAGRPETGLAPSTPNARNECRDEDGDDADTGGRGVCGGTRSESRSAGDEGSARPTTEARGGSQTILRGRTAASHETVGKTAPHNISFEGGCADNNATTRSEGHQRRSHQRGAAHGDREAAEGAGGDDCTPHVHPRRRADPGGHAHGLELPPGAEGSHRPQLGDQHRDDGDDWREGSQDAAPGHARRRRLLRDDRDSCAGDPRLHGILGARGAGDGVGSFAQVHHRTSSVEDLTRSADLSTGGRMERGAGIVPNPPPHRRADEHALDDDRGRGDDGHSEHRRKRLRREGARGHGHGQDAGGPQLGAAADGAPVDTPASTMPWQRPPSWLYLPSQGIHGHGLSEHLEDGVDADDAHGAGIRGDAIRGRLTAPGRDGQEATTLRCAAAAAALGTHGDLNMEANPAGAARLHPARAGAKAIATSAKRASDYIMQAYFARHQERVMKRREAEGQAGQQATDSAAQRMAALRRRLEERRAVASQVGVSTSTSRGAEPSQSSCAGEAADSSCTWSPGAPTSSEDAKIHQGLGDRIHVDPAERRGGPAENIDAGGVDNAAAAAACRVAWHSLGAGEGAPP